MAIGTSLNSIFSARQAQQANRVVVRPGGQELSMRRLEKLSTLNVMAPSPSGGTVPARLFLSGLDNPDDAEGQTLWVA